MRVSYEKMFAQFERVLLKNGFTQPRAELCAQLFADASRDGVYTHGLNRFPRFIEYIQKGYIQIHAIPEKLEVCGALGRQNGTGQFKRPFRYGPDHRTRPGQWDWLCGPATYESLDAGGFLRITGSGSRMYRDVLD